MGDDLLALVVELREMGVPFALATVVRCEPPTSAKPGARALIRPDGSVTGWIGGACAEPVVVREALCALADGEPRLVALVGEGGAVRGRVEGLVTYPMSCHSGGTLEIYVEPFVPKPVLMLIGHGPVVDALAGLARAVDFSVSVLAGDAVRDELNRRAPGPSASVVVATHGADDEDVLALVVSSEAGYVSLIASRKRASAIMESLRHRGLSDQVIGRIKAPAGIAIGAETPAEIAVSILAELVQHRRELSRRAALVHESVGTVPTEARDPVCGMSVEIAGARHRSERAGGPVYFCCAGCKESFDREPQRYATVASAADMPRR